MQEHPVHVRTFTAGCVFTLAVWAGTAFSAATPIAAPPPTHGISTAVLSSTSTPSDHDRLVALARRVDKLQVKLAATTTQADTAEVNVEFLADCLSGVLVATDPGTSDLYFAGEPGGDALTLAVLDETCATDVVEPGA